MTIAVGEKRRMTGDEITLKLNSPITEEQWDEITDVDFDNTDRIWFSTKHGKEVEFVKIVRCKDCEHFWDNTERDIGYWCGLNVKPIDANDYCSSGERKYGN